MTRGTCKRRRRAAHLGCITLCGLALAACGDNDGNEQESTAAAPTTTAAAQTVELPASVGRDLAEAKVAIATYCLAILREGQATDEQETGVLEGVDTVIDTFRSHPDAEVVFTEPEQTMRQYVLDVISMLENGDCALDLAERLERELENTP